jgi:ribose 5-phosphate isomerase B
MKIFVGSDHAGFALKKRVIAVLRCLCHDVVDCGPARFVASDDYVDYCLAVARAVSRTKGSMGVVIGGSGVGEAIVANKVRGIRAAQVYDRFTAVKSREHNDANIISLRSRRMPVASSLKLLQLWLKTPFSNAARHARRIRKIARAEAR